MRTLLKGQHWVCNFRVWGKDLETQNQTSTLEYVFKKPAAPQFKKYAEMTPEERNAWNNYFSIWTWRALENLISTKNFNPSLKAIAKRLNIKLDEAVDALEGLEFLKLIKRTPTGGLIRTTNGVDINELEAPHTEFLKGHLLLSAEVSSRVFDFQNIRLENFVVASNRTQIAKFINSYKNLVRELSEQSDSQERDEVFALVSSFACISTPRGDREATK